MTRRFLAVGSRIQSWLRGMVVAGLCGWGALTHAAPKVVIDTPTDKAIVTVEKVDIQGSAAAVGGGAGIDLILVVDDSGSLAGTDPKKLRFQAIQTLLNQLAQGSNLHVGLVFFSASAQTAVTLRPVAEAVKPINDEIAKRQSPSGGTNIGAGIKNAQADLVARARTNSARVVLVFTDGEHNGSINPNTEAGVVKTAGGLVNVVGLGLTGSGKTNAETIARNGGGQLLTADKPEALVELFKSSKIVGIDRVTITNLTNKETVPATLTTGSYVGKQLPLAIGENKIEVSAYDTAGVLTKANLTVTRNSPNTANPSNPCTAVVPIGLQVIGDPTVIGSNIEQYQVQTIFSNGQVQTVEKPVWRDANQQIMGADAGGVIEQIREDRFDVMTVSADVCGRSLQTPVSLFTPNPLTKDPDTPATQPGSVCFDAGSPDYGFQIKGTRIKTANDTMEVDLCTVRLNGQKVDVYMAIGVPEVGLVFVASSSNNGQQAYGTPTFSTSLIPYAKNIELKDSGNVLTFPKLGTVLGALYGQYKFYILLTVPESLDILHPTNQIAPLQQGELVYVRSY